MTRLLQLAWLSALAVALLAIAGEVGWLLHEAVGRAW